MAAKPSRDMLTTGLVGSYLLASAWGLMLLGSVVILVTGTDSLDAAMGASFAMFAIVAGLLWIGGAICEGIGWVGLGRLYPGAARWIGWLEGSLPVLTLLVVSVLISMLDFSEGAAHFMIILQILHFLSALIWMAMHSPRALTVPAAVGYGLALLGGGALYACALADVDVEVVGLVMLVTLLSGGTIAHLATGIFFGRTRVIADSVNTF